MPPLFLAPPFSATVTSLSLPLRCLRMRASGPAITLYTIGRPSSKDEPYDAVIDTLRTRMAPRLRLETPWLRPASARKALEKEAADGRVLWLCDGGGRQFEGSEGFAEVVYNGLAEGGSRAVFVVGDADGLPEDVRNMKGERVQRVSLGPLTLTHRMCRLFLAEQIYRATEIRRGSGYHK